MGLCRKVEKWFDGLNFGFSHLHDYLGLHDYPGLKSSFIQNSGPVFWELFATTKETSASKDDFAP